MKGFIAILFMFLFSFASAWSNHTHFLDTSTNEVIRRFGCDVHQGRASAHFNRTIKALHRNNKWHGSHGTRAALARYQPVKNPIQVQTYFHIITKNSSSSSSSSTPSNKTSTSTQTPITPSMISQQLSVLNSAYNPSGITFKLINTTFSSNDTWSGPSDAGISAAKSALRQGSYSSLNIYFLTGLEATNLGTCSLPGDGVYPDSTPKDYIDDGCVINAFTMPNGTVKGYNMGKTAVHEVGHWFGLLHTFEGTSCGGDGDYVADTPQESVPTNGCPTGASVMTVKDSCKNVTGADPIHNYMDYSTDVCYESFSPLQAQRMVSLWNEYRSGL